MTRPLCIKMYAPLIVTKEKTPEMENSNTVQCKLYIAVYVHMQHRNIEKDNTIMYSGWKGGGSVCLQFIQMSKTMNTDSNTEYSTKLKNRIKHKFIKEMLLDKIFKYSLKGSVREK